MLNNTNISKKEIFENKIKKLKEDLKDYPNVKIIGATKAPLLLKNIGDFILVIMR